MRFAAPLWLFLLFLVPLLGALAVWYRRRTAARMTALSRRAVAMPPRAGLQIGLLLGALAALAVALAGPRWGRGEEPFLASGRNLAVAVDVSNSMLAQDVRPDRLGRAKADLLDLLDALRGDRVALLAFRGKGAMLCPFTADVAFLRESINGLSPESAPPGETDLADAIEKALAAFDKAQSDHNAIVLVSDGEDLTGRAETLAKEAGARGIPIFAVGVGSPQGAQVPGVTYQGKPVTSKLNDATLRAVAEASGGAYIPLAGTGTPETTLGAVYANHLARIEAEENHQREETAFADRTGLFAILAALLALAAACLSIGRPAALAALLLLPALSLRAVDDPAYEAQRAFREGRWAEAAEGYAKARAADPALAAQHAFNETVALHAAGDVTNALDRVRLVVGDPTLAPRAAALEGDLLLSQIGTATNDMQRVELRESAADAFARALRGAPDDPARRNLARALSELPELRAKIRQDEARERHKGTPPGALARELLDKQRAFPDRLKKLGKLPPAERIAAGEALAEELRAQADRWVPLVDALSGAIQDEAARTEAVTRAQSAQAALDVAADEAEALILTQEPLVAGEPLAYDLWKTFADPPALNAESIALATNALANLPPLQPAREDLPEVRALTEQFRALFPEWAEQKIAESAQQPRKEDDPPPFTAADRDAILKDTDALLRLLDDTDTPEAKRNVLDTLQAIAKRLPKPPPQNQPQNQDQQQDKQEQNQDQNQQQNQDQNQDSGQDQQQAQQQQEQEQQSKAEREAQAKQEDLEALLQKAADRAKEHEDDKRRARPALPPSIRDW